jgi:hypothetical protein
LPEASAIAASVLVPPPSTPRMYLLN